MIDLLKDHPKGEPVPAISLREPWAAAVAFLGKDVENRSKWPFKYRGPILSYASKTQMELEDFALLREIAAEEGFSEEERLRTSIPTRRRSWRGSSASERSWRWRC
jgi:hypothetical protein